MFIVPNNILHFTCLFTSNLKNNIPPHENMNFSANYFKTCFWPQRSKICRILCTWGVWSNTRAPLMPHAPSWSKPLRFCVYLGCLFFKLESGQWQDAVNDEIVRASFWESGIGETEMWEYVKERLWKRHTVCVCGWLDDRENSFEDAARLCHKCLLKIFFTVTGQS